MKALELLNKHLDHLAPYVIVGRKSLPSIYEQGFIPGYGKRSMAAESRESINREIKQRTGIISDSDVALHGAILPSTNPRLFSESLQGYAYGDDPVALKLRYPILEKSSLTKGDSIIQGREPVKASPKGARQMFEEIQREGQDPYLEFQYFGDKSPMIIESAQLLNQTYNRPDDLIQVANKYNIPSIWDEVDFNTMRSYRRMS
jgi:hypothetical protein